ncbi:hypothetical protein LAZ67_10001898 [Cordylochernes scorpioides]|uniref:Uncharacterized protein n=1 Tax=Cordylochernes scorpioides TaxID=51811 RepID=A0ABY6KYF4_9ARAC|nr:hypothetical protein LAZ67_10001898 [Cordylochernes scorpioides]
MRGTTFDDEEDFKTWLNNFFDTRPGEFWRNGIHKLVERWKKVVGCQALGIILSDELSSNAVCRIASCSESGEAIQIFKILKRRTLWNNGVHFGTTDRGTSNKQPFLQRRYPAIRKGSASGMVC